MNLRMLRYGLWALVAIVGIGIGALALMPEQGKKAFGEPFGGPFALVDQGGNPITDAAFRGHPSLVFFGFTHCPEVCPTTLYEMNGWLQELGPQGEAIRAYFVTVDPERDTPDVLGDYVTSVSDRVIGITGDAEAVASYLRQAGIYSSKMATNDGDYTMDHTASVFMLAPDGGLFGTIAYGESRDDAIAKLKRLAAG